MNILIADDHQLILDGLSNLLKSAFPKANIHTVSDKDSLFHFLKFNKVDVLLQDVKFGKDDARDFIEEIQMKYSATKIIIMTSISDSYGIKSILKKGVDGFVLKSESSDEIVSAIKEVSKGNNFLSAFATSVNSHENAQEILQLSRREQDVLKEILNEKSTKEIAEILEISTKTVEMHRGNLFLKLDVKNITGLVKKALLLSLME